MVTKTNRLTEIQLNALEQLTTELTTEQILWLSGYLEGRHATIRPTNKKVLYETGAGTPAGAGTKLTILFGTETGRSEALAAKLSDMAKSKNIDVQSFSMYDYNPRKLKD